jgi:shikimate dehydrogenase
MNHALQLLGSNSRYFAFNVEARHLQEALQALKVLDFRGVNVTIPHKRRVFDYLDRIDDSACRIGAVNCIVHEQGTLVGYNTDYLGFIKPLLDRGIPIEGKSALILGSGGAARAVVAGLADRDIASIGIINRTGENGTALAAWCREQLGFDTVSYLGDGRALSTGRMSAFDLIINTTPVGMHPGVQHSPLPKGIMFEDHHTVYDLIYNPRETLFLKEAERAGAQTLNGFEMLILQGLYSLKHWFPNTTGEIFSLQGEIISYTEKIIGV